jgi:hypothetical protein
MFYYILDQSQRPLHEKSASRHCIISISLTCGFASWCIVEEEEEEEEEEEV